MKLGFFLLCKVAILIVAVTVVWNNSMANFPLFLTYYGLSSKLHGGEYTTHSPPPRTWARPLPDWWKRGRKCWTSGEVSMPWAPRRLGRHRRSACLPHSSLCRCSCPAEPCTCWCRWTNPGTTWKRNYQGCVTKINEVTLVSLLMMPPLYNLIRNLSMASLSGLPFLKTMLLNLGKKTWKKKKKPAQIAWNPLVQTFISFQQNLFAHMKSVLPHRLSVVQHLLPAGHDHEVGVFQHPAHSCKHRGRRRDFAQPQPSCDQQPATNAPCGTLSIQ